MYTLFTNSSILLPLFFASPFFLPLPFTQLAVNIKPLVNSYLEGSLHPWILPSLHPQQQDRRRCCDGEERLINTGPMEAWLHQHLHHCQGGEPGAGGGDGVFSHRTKRRRLYIPSHQHPILQLFQLQHSPFDLLETV